MADATPQLKRKREEAAAQKKAKKQRKDEEAAALKDGRNGEPTTSVADSTPKSNKISTPKKQSKSTPQTNGVSKDEKRIRLFPFLLRKPRIRNPSRMYL